MDPNSHRGKRNRRAALTGGTALVARAVQVGTSLITIPIVIHYLGNERFGLWMTISSVLAIANFADFGLGNGVLNTVATAYGNDDRNAIREAISSGFAVLTAVAAAILVIFAAIFALVPWANVFHVTSAVARQEAGPALAVFVVCFVLNIPLDVVQRAQLGLQEGFRTNLWQIGGSMAGLAGVIAGVKAQAGLPLLVTALAGAPVFAAALNTSEFFFFSRRDLAPRWDFVSRATLVQIGKLGSLFFVLQIVVAVAFSVDNFIIARVLGAAQVPAYSIPQRMFSIISLVVAMLMAPLWPAYGEAIARDDMTWVRRTLSRSLLMVFAGAALASAILLALAKPILSWWIGPQIQSPALLLIGLAVWTVMDCCGNALAMFLNGAHIVQLQVVVASIFAVVCLLMKVWLTRRFGIVAVPWTTLGSYALLVAIPYAIGVPRLLRGLRGTSAPIAIAVPAHAVAEE